MNTSQQFQRLQEAFESGRISRRHFLQTACGLGLGGIAAQFLATDAQAAATPALTGPVNFACYSIYNIPEIFAGFKKETGVVVNCIDPDSDTMIILKGKQVPGFYDVFNFTGYFARNAWDAGVIEPFDVEAAIPHFEDVFPIFKQMPELRVPSGPDKGKFLGYPLEWGASAPLYRPDKVEAPPDSWAVLVNPKHRGRVGWDARPHYLFIWAAALLGFEVDKPGHPGVFHLTQSELTKVKEELIKWKKMVNPIFTNSTGELVKLFAANEIDVGMGISTSQILRVKFAGGPLVQQTVLKAGEKRFGWVSVDALAKAARHREAALAWIGYRSRPEALVTFFKKAGAPLTNRKVMEMLVAQGLGEDVGLVSGLAPERLLAGVSLVKTPSDVAAWQLARDELKAA